jgi:hypothetical protein
LSEAGFAEEPVGEERTVDEVGSWWNNPHSSGLRQPWLNGKGHHDKPSVRSCPKRGSPAIARATGVDTNMEETKDGRGVPIGALMVEEEAKDGAVE